MKIRVTKEHIKKGKPEACSSCPVALALKEAFPEAHHTMAGPSQLGLMDEDQGFTRLWDTPLIVREFITRFDSNKPVEPFEFELTDV